MAEPEESTVTEEEEVEPEEEVAPEAQETPETPKEKQSNELKIVIILNEGKVMLGVQSPDCDPIYTTFEGTLPAALKKIPKFVAEAREKWSAAPLNPEANLPKPEPTPAPARTAAAPKRETAQPSFF